MTPIVWRNAIAEYETLLTAITLKPKGEALYSDEATRISLDDTGGGMFVTVSQGYREICINPDEWTTLRDAIERMLALCDDSSAETAPGRSNTRS